MSDDQDQKAWEGWVEVGDELQELRARLREQVKNSFGYQSKSPCEVCGQHKNNQQEPRFLYVVCEDHQHVPPNQIQEQQR